jgi:photosystem II stability/assembly factor-like uncharacterized protein
MSNISGTNLAAKIVPFTTLDTYPTHEDIYGFGGFMCVADISERNAIPASRRKQGMQVAVISEGITYQLSGGILDSNWISFGPSYFYQSSEPSIGEKTFIFWQNSSNNKMYIIAKIDGFQKKAELLGTDYVTQNSGVPLADLYDIFFLDQNIGWACGGHLDSSNHRGVIGTTDGGATWSTKFVTSPSNPFRSIHFLDPSYGWIISENGYLGYTLDGGISWTSKTIAANSFLGQMQWTDSSTAYIAGSDSLGFTQRRVFKTNDGGNTWNLTLDASYVGLVFFIDNSIGWIGGNSYVFHTIDGGITWTPQSTGIVSSNNIYAMYFVDSNIGYIAGDPGSFRKTINGGTTWTGINPGTSQTISDLNFTDASNGLFSAGSGLVKNTTDGGATWNTLTTDTSNALIRIFRLNPSKNWICGQGGSIITGNN